MSKIFNPDPYYKDNPLIENYLKEFPNDKDFIEICNARFGIVTEELEEMLKNRKPGQRIISIPDRDDHETIIYVNPF
jgi:hypothetical protein